MIERFSLRLADSYMLAPTVRHMSFERADAKPLALTAGQFVQIHFPDGSAKPPKRSFSVATACDADGGPIERVELAVSYVDGGLATKVLGGLEPGGSIEATGPFGRFYFMDEDTNARYILVATGTGIAPYRAMRARMARLMRERGCEFVLLYGARNETELLYGEEFEAFAREHERFTYHPCLSRGARPAPRPHDRLGHVQDVFPEIAPDPERDIAYLCGNPDMVDDAFQRLKDAGLSVRQIRREKYVSSR